MTQILGKGIYLWVVPQILRGDPAKIANLLNELQIERVEIKVAQAQYTYIIPRWVHLTWGRNLKPEWLAEFRRHFKGEVWGWSFNIGYSPAAEGRKAAELVNELGLDGYGMDIEGTFERQPNAADRADQLMTAFRTDAPNIPVMWVSWPLFKSPYGSGGTWHNHQVAKRGMEYCQYGAPMVYWPKSGEYWVRFWLENSLKQWRELVTDKPLIPVGRAYTGDGGIGKAEDIALFDRLVRDKGLLGESWWVLRHAISKPDWKEAIRVIKPWEPETPPPQVPVAVWRNGITTWAKKMGYDGPYPFVED